MTIQEKLVRRGWANSTKEANTMIQVFMEEMAIKLNEDGYIQIGGYLNMKVKNTEGGKSITMPNKTTVVTKPKTKVRITAGKRLISALVPKEA